MAEFNLQVKKREEDIKKCCPDNSDVLKGFYHLENTQLKFLSVSEKRKKLQCGRGKDLLGHRATYWWMQCTPITC